jgi:transcriptional regulator with XRE-family HTH domain
MRAKPKLTQQDLRLARYLQKVRKAKGITQEQLAEKVGVSTTWIGYIETGLSKPNLKLLYKIARVLDVKVKDLIPF